ncbi:MAG: O-acetyl-ADP-ribose deacetylase [Thermoplasmatota archaeon]
MLEARLRHGLLVLVEGDITKQAADGIVNAANSSLMGGGGVDGAIHRAGGPAILAECRELARRIGRLPPGRAVATTAGNLRARAVIHTVGPVWRGGGRGEAETLASCYRECLRLARERGLRTLAFPSISTGAYGYPMEEAARVALGAVVNFLESEEGVDAVTFVLRGREALETHSRVLGSLLGR